MIYHYLKYFKEIFTLVNSMNSEKCIVWVMFWALLTPFVVSHKDQFWEFSIFVKFLSTYILSHKNISLLTTYKQIMKKKSE